MSYTKRYFSLILLTVFAAQADSHKRKKSKIDTPVIQAIDGTGLMDAATFDDCYKTWGFIHGIQFKPQKISFQGKLVALKDLVIFEVKNKNIDKQSSLWQEFLVAKKQFIEWFTEETLKKKQSVESSSASEATKKIVDFWLEKQGITNSLLKNWGTPQEETSLYEATARELFSFLDDLRHFMEDFMYSCPKARADFERYLKNEDERKAFAKFFND